jgi:hypothetical protein
MIRLQRNLVMIALGLTAKIATAGELQWQFLGASSFGHGLSCATDNVTVSSAGNDLSIVYGSSMAVNLPAGEQPKVHALWGHCLVFLKLTVPAGETITRTQASVIGGVEKDKGAYGYVTAITYLTQKVARSINPFIPGAPLGPVLYLNREMLHRETLSEPLFVMNQSRDLSVAQKKSICRLTADKSTELGMTIRLAVAAVRPNASKTAIINVDTVDRHLDLAMNTESCH